MNNTEILPHGTLFFTSGSHPVTTDSSLLARFAVGNPASGEFAPNWSVCDLGSGNGMLLLHLLDAGLYGRAVGVEKSAEGAGLLRAAVEMGQFINVTAVQTDLRDYQSPLPFDAVVTNPPYYAGGALPKGEARAMARHQGAATLDEVLAAAARLLKEQGRLYLCWPAAQKAELLAAFAAHGFAPRALQAVRAEGKPQPWLLLADARKAGGGGAGDGDTDTPEMETLPEQVIAKAEAGAGAAAATTQ